MDLFRFSRSKSDRRAPNITWGSKSIARGVSRTSLFLKRQLWIWPIIAAVVLGALAFGVRQAIQSTMKENLRSQLETLLSVETAMLENWAQVQTANATALANDPHVREAVYQLLADLDSDAAMTAASTADVHKKLNERLAPYLSAHGFVRYLVADKSQRILSASSAELIGRVGIPQYQPFISRALEGRTTICPPFSSVIPIQDEAGQVRTGVPTMFVCAPIRDENFQVVAALSLRIRPELEFTRIMQLGRVGQSGG